MRAEDLTGKMFGNLKVIKKSNVKGKDNRTQWLCVCECGNKVSVRPGSLKSGDTSSCGCRQGREKLNLIGRVYHRLTVIEEVGKTKANKYIYKCECECGNYVNVVSSNLRTGNTQSCGCYNLEIVKKNNFEDLSGKRFGRLVVTNNHYSNNRQRRWKCICDCGNEAIVVSSDLKKGHTQSCGCLQKEKASMTRYIDLKGKTFGRLTVEKELNPTNNKRMWLCQCSCGNKSIVSTNALNRKNTRSCGCILKEMIGEKSPRYDKRKTNEERLKGRYMLGGKNAVNWRKEIFVRDKYTCVVCGRLGGSLNAHHLDGWNWCKEKRFEISNGVTLCKVCHDGFHKRFGKGDNTKEQFEEFKLLALVK